MLREGNLEQAASFTSVAWEDGGSNPAIHARDVLSEQYAPLVYHSGYKLAGTTQLSASRAFVFAGSISAAASPA
jgi:acyl-CoA reductase-like NAD-dependent aldehyde dehydrogenase